MGLGVIRLQCSWISLSATNRRKVKMPSTERDVKIVDTIIAVAIFLIIAIMLVTLGPIIFG